MITVTESAQNELTKYFADKDVQPIRVHLADGGCAGPRLALALDEVRDNDKSVQQGDFTFLIDAELAEATGAVAIDMTAYGFTVDSENQVGGGGCGCSSSGSCGSAGSGGCGC
ncbi:MAG: IscA/HesB family protein [Pseudodesulfovibrio sp.]|jgi:Fe-S cluster assembly iron-binding protein IscA|uniref:Fe-S cluster assembly iron-binding protein IscA n=1 Tax=Pseudodesulfovibrio indicus TaxID=1716143 RepID=A0A126QKP1_9BACT|nr:IscA/HesB family protein [Pseudodesulfovibrio indicus]AMK10610.1 heme biosynthesis protein HemY [Pseudodesulfovibrio indicus]TDT82716.1 Fe-S cluster assembly iron-binding protein IscA [Pseudodesulfovibrio indicus]